MAWVALVATVLWGIIGYFSMPQRKDPDIPVTTAMAIVPWPGMDAERVEERVTRRIEEVVARELARRRDHLDHPDRGGLRLHRSQGRHHRDRRDLRRHRAQAGRDRRSARGRRADPVHQGLRQHRGADADGGEPAAGRGAGGAPGRPGARGDRAAAGGRRRGRAGHAGLQLPALDLRRVGCAARHALSRAGDARRRAARRPAARGPPVRRRRRRQHRERQRAARSHPALRRGAAPRLRVPSRRVAGGA